MNEEWVMHEEWRQWMKNEGNEWRMSVMNEEWVMHEEWRQWMKNECNE